MRKVLKGLIEDIDSKYLIADYNNMIKTKKLAGSYINMNRFKAWLRAKGFTQTELSKILGVSQGTVSQLMIGRLTIAEFKVLLRLLYENHVTEEGIERLNECPTIELFYTDSL